MAHLVFHVLYLLRVQGTSSETEVGELYVPSTVNKEVLGADFSHNPLKAGLTHLGFEITVDVSKLVKLIHTGKHFSRIEFGMLLLEDAGVIKQRAEVSSGHVFLPMPLARAQRIMPAGAAE